MFFIYNYNTNSKVPNVEFQTYDDAMNWFVEYGNIIDYTIIEE